MKRSETRYQGVWDAGYDAACENLSAALLKLFHDGGEIRADDAWGFGYRFKVKLNGAKGPSFLAADNLRALVPFGKSSE